MSTIANTIAVMKVSSLLASDYIAKQRNYGNSIIDDRYPMMLTTERIIIEKIYAKDPVYANLQIAADYGYDLCGRWKLQAQAIVDGSSGGVVPPVVPGTSVLPLYLKSSDFADSTHYNNPDIVGLQLSLFVNEYTQQWLFMPDDIVGTSTGINVLVPGFDALTTDYTMILMKVNTP